MNTESQESGSNEATYVVPLTTVTAGSFAAIGMGVSSSTWHESSTSCTPCADASSVSAKQNLMVVSSVALARFSEYVASGISRMSKTDACSHACSSWWWSWSSSEARAVPRQSRRRVAPSARRLEILRADMRTGGGWRMRVRDLEWRVS